MQYKYTAITDDDEVVNGEMLANNITNLKQKLKNRSLTYVRSKPVLNWKRLIPAILHFLLKLSRVRQSTLREFTHGMKLLLEIGLSISQALDTMASTIDSKIMQHVLRNVKQKIDNGYNLNQAFSGYPFIFNKYFTSILEYANLSIHVKEIFSRIESEKTTRFQLLFNLSIQIIPYLSLFIFTIILWVMFYNSLLQEFIWGYNRLRITMPSILIFTVHLTTDIAHNWFYYTGLLLGAFILIRILLFSKWIRLSIDYITTKIPFISSLSYNTNLNQFYNTLNTSLQSKIHLIPSFDVSRKTLTNSYYAILADKMCHDITQGKSLEEALHQHHLLRRVEAKLLIISEKTGSIPETVSAISNNMRFRVQRSYTILTEVCKITLLLMTIFSFFFLVEVIDQGFIPLVPYI